MRSARYQRAAFGILPNASDEYLTSTKHESPAAGKKTEAGP
jgi:hypothetical protein